MSIRTTNITVTSAPILDIIILLCILAFSFLANSYWLYDNCASIITALSMALIALSLYQLNKNRIPMVSFPSVFTILLHAFSLGNYYIMAFGKESYFLTGNWFANDLAIKAKSGLFSLCAIEAIFVGMIHYIEREEYLNQDDYKTMSGLSITQKEEVIFRTGVMLLMLSLPFRLYIDYNNVMTSTINGVYSGFSGIVGLADDIEILFIPALICIMYGKRNNSAFTGTVLVLYTILCVLVMAASGSRRYYVTAIVSIFLCYTCITESRKKGLLRNVVTILLLVITLNLMTMIRNYRHTTLGISYLVSNHMSELFSTDFLWGTLAEFGITGNTIYYALLYFPSSIPFQLGYTYFASFIYILPIGWLIRLDASVGSILYRVTNSAVGGSILADLYANWGWFSIIPAVVLGYFISKLCYVRSGNASTLREVMKLAASYVAMNYVRSSTVEIVRYSAYILIAIYLVSRFCAFYVRREEMGKNGFYYTSSI